jgi:hypothetical protein
MNRTKKAVAGVFVVAIAVLGVVAGPTVAAQANPIICC